MPASWHSIARRLGQFIDENSFPAIYGPARAPIPQVGDFLGASDFEGYMRLGEPIVAELTDKELVPPLAQGQPSEDPRMRLFLAISSTIKDINHHLMGGIASDLRLLKNPREFKDLIEEAITYDVQLGEARHSKDFRSVHWFGKDFTFTAIQAAVVGVLWAAWEHDVPDVGDATLLMEAGSDSKRLVDLFKGHPAWATVIVEGKTKGSRRLVRPGIPTKN